MLSLLFSLWISASNLIIFLFFISVCLFLYHQTWFILLVYNIRHFYTQFYSLLNHFLDNLPSYYNHLFAVPIMVNLYGQFSDHILKDSQKALNPFRYDYILFFLLFFICYYKSWFNLLNLFIFLNFYLSQLLILFIFLSLNIFNFRFILINNFTDFLFLCFKCIFTID